MLFKAIFLYIVIKSMEFFAVGGEKCSGGRYRCSLRAVFGLCKMDLIVNCWGILVLTKPSHILLIL